MLIVVEDQRVALPVSDGAAVVGRPEILLGGVRPAVRVDPQDIRTVLGQDHDLFGRDGELVDVRDVHHPGEPVRRPARADGIRKRPLLDQLDMLFVQRFPFIVVRRKLPDARIAGTAIGRLHGRRIEHRGPLHHPGAAPVWQGLGRDCR